MYIPMEEIENALAEYEEQKHVILRRNDDAEIVEKVKAYEQELRNEYDAKKQSELRDIEISIEAVERIKSRALDENQNLEV